MPNLAVGETYLIVLEIAVPEERREIGSVTIHYSDTFTRTNERYELMLRAPGQLAPDLVTLHALQLWTSEVVFWKASPAGHGPRAYSLF